MSEHDRTAWDILDGILECDDRDAVLNDLEQISLYASNGLDLHISDECARLIQYLGESITRRIKLGEIPDQREWHALEEACKALSLN
jgi:hypothetical protein